MIQATVSAAPVEYAVAVDRYLAEAQLGLESRRVYRISLAGWAWPLVGKQPPAGRSRRGARPPIVPLALLDQAGTEHRLAKAVAHRVQHAGPRTVNRELSVLRSAIGWWQRRQWISADPTAALRSVTALGSAAARPLTQPQLHELFSAQAGLREHAFWHLLHDSGASAEAILALNASVVDLGTRRARLIDGTLIEWNAATSQLLSWLLAGRRHGPVFLTDRRAPESCPAADLCPLTGRGRMSYRRAAEIFTQHSRRLDPAGRGWTLHQLSPTATNPDYALTRRGRD